MSRFRTEVKKLEKLADPAITVVLLGSIVGYVFLISNLLPSVECFVK